MTQTIHGKIRILFAIELLILLIVTALAVYKQNHPVTITPDPDGLSAGNPAFSGLDLSPGSYSLIINYNTDNDIYFTITGNDGSADIRSSYGFLRYQYDNINFRFRTHDRLSSLSVNTDLSDGLTISSILLTDNCDNLIRLLIILIAVFIIADYLIWLFAQTDKDNIGRTILTISALAGITIAASMPLFIPGILMGHDIAIHLQRIESIYQDLLRGAFPVRIDSSALRNYGYPISVYYGDILLYPAALLRMAHFDITETWKIYFFSMNAATAIITYICSDKIFHDRVTALTLACAYTTVPYRLGNLYARSAVGEFSAMTFYPVIALAVYKIYTEEIDAVRSRRYSGILALSLSCVICTHILSSEMIVFTLLIIAVVLFKKTFRRDILLTLIKAAIKTLLISAFFIVPFIDYYISTPTLISEIVSGQVPQIQSEGLKLTDFFSLPLTQDSCYSSPGIVFTLTLIAGIIILLSEFKNRNKKAPLTGFLVFISLLITVMSTRYFPWDLLGVTHAGRIMGQIQFPWRFISILAILLTILLGRIMTDCSKEKHGNHTPIIVSCVVCAASILACALITFVCAKNLSAMTPINNCDLDSEAVGSGEYVLSGANIWFREINDKLLSDSHTGTVIEYMQDGTGIILQCKTDDTARDVLIPKYNYKGYRAYDKDKNRLKISDGSNRLVSVTLPASYEGPVYIKYEEPFYWRLAEIISLISLIIVVGQFFCICPSVYRHKS